MAAGMCPRRRETRRSVARLSGFCTMSAEFIATEVGLLATVVGPDQGLETTGCGTRT